MTCDLAEMYITRIAMSANLPYPIPRAITQRKLYDCCGLAGGFMLHRHMLDYEWARAIMEIENGMNLVYWFPDRKEGDEK